LAIYNSRITNRFDANTVGYSLAKRNAAFINFNTKLLNVSSQLSNRKQFGVRLLSTTLVFRNPQKLNPYWVTGFIDASASPTKREQNFIRPYSKKALQQVPKSTSLVV
jgi:hypothetical protein